jgi:hypothetical protein
MAWRHAIRLQGCEPADRSGRRLPVGGEVRGRPMKLGRLSGHRKKRFRPDRAERVTNDQRTVRGSKQRDVTRGVTGRVDPRPARQSRHGAVGRQHSLVARRSESGGPVGPRACAQHGSRPRRRPPDHQQVQRGALKRGELMTHTTAPETVRCDVELPGAKRNAAKGSTTTRATGRGSSSPRVVVRTAGAGTTLNHSVGHGLSQASPLFTTVRQSPRESASP